MTIRSKIIQITLPLIITPLALTLVVSILSSRNGITNVATEFLNFKTQILYNYCESQWDLLTSNNLEQSTQYVEVSKSSVEVFSRTLINNESEHIFAFNTSGKITMQTTSLEINPMDFSKALENIDLEHLGWKEFTLEKQDYISVVSYFEPFDWYLTVAVEKEAFFGTITKIIYRTLIIFFIAILISAALLLSFSKYLTKPIKKIVEVIRNIISTNDLSTKVPLQYSDEIGELGNYFNIMTEELNLANDQLKTFALKAVMAKRKEMKIRNVFQKYVPNDVIEKIFSEPESMLEGDNRVLGILFSDIRSFTTFSEKLPPHEVVESLNKYFEFMVDTITKHGGIVDKYIGDAIMAFFGAPVKHPNDALLSVEAGLEMVDKLRDFNRWQLKYRRDPFEIGIGINYGIATVGNIGTEKKMDYTVIGDMVNLASRLEGLTKKYKEPLLVSESIQKKIHKDYPCRLIDKVIVKGKSESVNIYSVQRELSPKTIEAWGYHEEGITSYYERNFTKAIEAFSKVQKILPSDFCSQIYFGRSKKYLANPPGKNWTGFTALSEK